MGLLPPEVLERTCTRENDTPYLLNISDDPMLSGCLMYFVPQGGGATTIGRGEANAIRLEGLGIPDALCSLTNERNSQILLHNPDGNRVLVNGLAVP